ncbi:hypothetical protein FHW36_103165 [Chitinophaga polysaccharea]|uniref:Uncharacterized protein n=1 Tax=Chitinophaga polysaccharea TaxID=1293035 RepID=A0A561PTB6_9BACT|nr:hypothetical protein FHW36_103165 [Chitinophaga polysaccharea]
MDLIRIAGGHSLIDDPADFNRHARNFLGQFRG